MAVRTCQELRAAVATRDLVTIERIFNPRMSYLVLCGAQEPELTIEAAKMIGADWHSEQYVRFALSIDIKMRIRADQLEPYFWLDPADRPTTHLLIPSNMYHLMVEHKSLKLIAQLWAIPKMRSEFINEIGYFHADACRHDWVHELWCSIPVPLEKTVDQPGNIYKRVIMMTSSVAGTKKQRGIELFLRIMRDAPEYRYIATTLIHPSLLFPNRNEWLRPSYALLNAALPYMEDMPPSAHYLALRSGVSHDLGLKEVAHMHDLWPAILGVAILLVSNGYYWVANDSAWNTARFFSIAMRLPEELQLELASYVFSRKGDELATPFHSTPPCSESAMNYYGIFTGHKIKAATNKQLQFVLSAVIRG